MAWAGYLWALFGVLGAGVVDLVAGFGFDGCCLGFRFCVGLL